MRDPLRCAYCGNEVLGHINQAYHAVACERAPWNRQPGWQAVALVDVPWWRRLLRRG